MYEYVEVNLCSRMRMYMCLFLMFLLPPRSTPCISSASFDGCKRHVQYTATLHHYITPLHYTTALHHCITPLHYTTALHTSPIHISEPTTRMRTSSAVLYSKKKNQPLTSPSHFPILLTTLPTTPQPTTLCYTHNIHTRNTNKK